ncbi:MAG TPA: asparagine synthase (glutamine-hydrolyzing), partial [Ferruginibacter sp.]|nr:asparagine synthase (glutamine-hydrolyzing) [Ferruginibacter sp.]
MCGLAGSVDFPLHFESMRAALQHRGPDEQTIWQTDNIHLFHARLSIVDKTGGVQPMHHRNRYTIVFNGEIYNHNELRKQHNLNGQTHSDTETILLLYERFGADCLQQLDGMFVLVIYDQQEKTLFIARDRAGKKPLYLYNDGQKILFASELNALRSQLRLELNKNNFYHYLRLGVFYRELTPFQHVTEMPAGSWMTINCQNRRIQSHRWWNIHDFYAQPQQLSFEEALTETNIRLQQSVRRRLESSDLEVGAFLSGGIDSGLVTAIASNLHPKIKTFTVSFEGAYDEAPLAKLVAERYQTDHTEIRISFRNLQNDIEKILCNYGEP